MPNDNNISINLSAVCVICRPSSNLTAPQPLPFCLSAHPPICLSYHPFLALLTVQSSSSSCPSVCPSSCLSCPGCVDSSSVSCHHSVLLRHGHWSDACTLSADGQATVLSHTTFFFFSTIFSLFEKVYFSCFPSLAAAFNLSFSVICLQLHPPLIADHLVAGKLTERETWRRIENIKSL